MWPLAIQITEYVSLAIGIGAVLIGWLMVHDASSPYSTSSANEEVWIVQLGIGLVIIAIAIKYILGQ